MTKDKSQISKLLLHNLNTHPPQSTVKACPASLLLHHRVETATQNVMVLGTSPNQTLLMLKCNY